MNKTKWLLLLARMKGYKLSRNVMGNIMGVLGLVLIGIGIFLFSVPIGFIASGIMSIVIGSQIVTNGADNEYPR